MRYTEIDRSIEALAAKQYGVFSREQAFELGASERFVARRLAQKHWTRPTGAVYALAQSAGTWKRQCKIAELSVDGAAIAGRSAAVLHGIPGFKAGRVELWTPINAKFRNPIARIHRYAGATLTIVDGIRVTTVPQTLFDAAIVLDPWMLERAVDDCLLERKVTVAELDERLMFYAGSRRPGLPRIRPLIEERREDGWTPAESELEALLFSVLERLPGSPRVVRQAPMPWRTNMTLRVDALLPDHNLIIEADGRRWHTRVQDFVRDQWRHNEAVAHGFRVMHFTWVHLHDFSADAAEVIWRTISPRTAA